MTKDDENIYCIDDSCELGNVFYTCAMHPEIHQNHPGNCPKCGMTLEKEVEALPTISTKYTCAMHPEIIKDEPGNCPICEMALEPVTVKADEKIKNLLMGPAKPTEVYCVFALVLYPHAQV